MQDEISFEVLPEEQRLACYGAFFAMAAADGKISEHEVTWIFEALATEGLSEATKNTLHSYLVSPPTLADCLSTLQGSSEALRYGVLLQLIEIAMADDFVVRGERVALEQARQQLGLDGSQTTEIETFIQEMRQRRDEPEAAPSFTGWGPLSLGVAMVTPVGVGVGLAWLQAMPLADPLAPLRGLGFGLGPVAGGVAMAALAGLIFGAMTLALRSTGTSPGGEERHRQELLITNLQQSIGDLAQRVQLTSDDAQRQALQERLRELQRLLARKRGQLAER